MNLGGRATKRDVTLGKKSNTAANLRCPCLGDMRWRDANSRPRDQLSLSAGGLEIEERGTHKQNGAGEPGSRTLQTTPVRLTDRARAGVPRGQYDSRHKSSGKN